MVSNVFKLSVVQTGYSFWRLLEPIIDETQMVLERNEMQRLLGSTLVQKDLT